ncbi:hypothetical protein ACWD5R_11290 [Streptomyces sp. NPDC002514]|uniref:hypothetical protein n=1 Tax=Streptomyces sp. NPDC001270 TaxID=3364554 RepID=UPI00367F5B83
MTISSLALTAKRVIEAAWLDGPSYDLATQAAEALESAQLLQSPETAAEHERLRKSRDAFRDQRNAVFGTNERLHAQVEESGQARLLAENETRSVRREADALRTSLEKRTALLREVQAMCRQRGKEIAGRKAYGDQLKAEAAELRDLSRKLVEQARDARAMVTAMRPDYQAAGRLRARVAELEAALCTKDRPVDEDPIAYALTDQAAAEADGITQRIAPVQALREDETAAVCQCGKPGADPYSCEADDCSGHFSELNPFAGARPVDERSAEVSRKCGACGWRTTVWHVDDGSAEQELHEHVVRVHGRDLIEAGGERS